MLIADIGGYTRFMKVHRVNLAHAQFVIAKLLESVIDGAGKRLKLAKLEGDAAFFYVELPGTGEPDLTSVRQAVADIRRSFATRQHEFSVDQVCNCDSCDQASELTLKFVAHLGDVAFQRVKKLSELAGVDVIILHRLLKNSVPLVEYLLMTPVVHENFGEDLVPQSVEQEEDLEGLGVTATYYVHADAIGSREPLPFAPSFFRRWWGWLRMTVMSVPYFLGLRKPCAGFRNLGGMYGTDGAACLVEPVDKSVDK